MARRKTNIHKLSAETRDASSRISGRKQKDTSEKTFDEVLALWLDHNRIRLKGGTINKYQSLIDAHISPELGDLKISAISSTRINRFLEEKLRCGRRNHQGPLSASYVGSIMLVINAAVKFAIGEPLCQPLTTPILKPTHFKTEIPVLDLKTQKLLEAALYRDPTPTTVGILISLQTGLRIGEICALSWADICILF